MKQHILTLAAGALMLASCQSTMSDSGQRHERSHDKDRYNNDVPPNNDGVGPNLTGPDSIPTLPGQSNPNNVLPIDTQKQPEPPNPIEPPVNPAPAPTQPANTAANIPYGKPVPGKRGFVTSPYDAAAGMIDVRDIPPGTKVKDPYTGKVFLVP